MRKYVLYLMAGLVAIGVLGFAQKQETAQERTAVNCPPTANPVINVDPSMTKAPDVILSGPDYKIRWTNPGQNAFTVTIPDPSGPNPYSRYGRVNAYTWDSCDPSATTATNIAYSIQFNQKPKIYGHIIINQPVGKPTPTPKP